MQLLMQQRPCLENLEGSEMDHPLRSELSGELHARPFLKISTAVSLEHFAVHVERDSHTQFHEALLQTLCYDAGIARPTDGVTHYATQLRCGRQLKWERHTEFSTFTFVAPRHHNRYFDAETSTTTLPSAWLEKMAGTRIVAVRMELLTSGEAGIGRDDLSRWFDGPIVVGSRVMGGGKVFCDWTVRSDGFMRFLVIDDDFREAQSGRLLQRIHEIETYRMMALLALPVARKMARDLDDINSLLQALMRRLEETGALTDDAGLLLELTHLAVRIESLAGHGSRFSASRAYEMLVHTRIQELREERIEGMPTIAEFMERRFAPAMQTCRSVWNRHEQTAQRVARAVDLLRTRVNLSQEKDVTSMLAGMERTASHQLHLQHAVEGLSVAAISYYVLSLAGAAFRAMHELHLPVAPELAEGLLIVPVVLMVIGITKRARRRVLRGNLSRGDETQA
jgi:uncharacterized membrane-anchored protein